MPEFIEDNLRLIIIVVIVGAALLQKILEAVKAAKTAAPPVMQQPPPPVRQRAVRAPQLPPPLAHDEGELARQRKLEERLRQIRAAGTAATPVATFAPVASHAVSTASHVPIAAHAPRTTPAAAGVIRQRLRRSRELRRAFITKEILDRPLGLR